MSARVRTSRSRLRTAAAIGAAVLLAGACSTSSEDGSGGASPLPGIDAETAKVGYLIVDIGAVKGSLGLVQADYGNTETIVKGIQATVDYVNANGGAGGRQLEAEMVPYDGSVGTPEQSQQLCADLTQDRGVFAAVLDGQFHSNVVPCYAGANTLVMDTTTVAHDQKQFEEHAPYLWAPSLPEYGSFLQTQLEVLADEGFVEAGDRVQLLTADNEVARRAVDDIAKPFLDDVGVGNVQVDYIDVTNTGTIGASAASAIQSGKSGKAERVITVGGARILSIALADYGARDYEALWSMTTFDNPFFVQENDGSLQTARRPGMTGIGYHPAADVGHGLGPAFPDPDNATQQLCHDIVTDAGAAPPTAADGSELRENWRLALVYCDTTLFLAEVLDNVGTASEVTAQDFADGAAAIGDSLPTAVGFTSSWGPNVFAGPNSAKVLKWDDDCDCFDYEGETFELSSPSG